MGSEPRSALIRRFVPGIVLALAGLAILALAGGATAAVVAGFFLAGLGAVWLVSAAFFTVGRSEDLDRERHPRG